MKYEKMTQSQILALKMYLSVCFEEVLDDQDIEFLHNDISERIKTDIKRFLEAKIQCLQWDYIHKYEN
jgi:hypothetical protein